MASRFTTFHNSGMDTPNADVKNFVATRAMERFLDEPFGAQGMTSLSSFSIDDFRFECKKLTPLLMEIKVWPPNGAPRYFTMRISEML